MTATTQEAFSPVNVLSLGGEDEVLSAVAELSFEGDADEARAGVKLSSLDRLVARGSCGPDGLGQLMDESEMKYSELPIPQSEAAFFVKEGSVQWAASQAGQSSGWASWATSEFNAVQETVEVDGEEHEGFVILSTEGIEEVLRLTGAKVEEWKVTGIDSTFFPVLNYRDDEKTEAVYLDDPSAPLDEVLAGIGFAPTAEIAHFQEHCLWARASLSGYARDFAAELERRALLEEGLAAWTTSREEAQETLSEVLSGEDFEALEAFGEGSCEGDQSLSADFTGSMGWAGAVIPSGLFLKFYSGQMIEALKEEFPGEREWFYHMLLPVEVKAQIETETPKISVRGLAPEFTEVHRLERLRDNSTGRALLGHIDDSPGIELVISSEANVPFGNFSPAEGQSPMEHTRELLSGGQPLRVFCGYSPAEGTSDFPVPAELSSPGETEGDTPNTLAALEGEGIVLYKESIPVIQVVGTDVYYLVPTAQGGYAEGQLPADTVDRVLEELLDLFTLGEEGLAKVERASWDADYRAELVGEDFRGKYSQYYEQKLEDCRQRREQAREQAQEKEAELAQIYRRHEDAGRELSALEAQDGDMGEHAQREFDRIRALDKVEDVYYEDGMLCFRTETLFCFQDDYSRAEACWRKIGRFLGKMPVNPSRDQGNVRMFNLDRRRKGRNAPHIYGRGHMCSGDFGHTASQLVGSGQFELLAEQLIAFVESVNLRDTFGKDIDAWPEATNEELQEHGIDPDRRF